VLLSGVTDVCKEVSFGGLVCLDALWELLWSGLKGFCCDFYLVRLCKMATPAIPILSFQYKLGFKPLV